MTLKCKERTKGKKKVQVFYADVGRWEQIYRIHINLWYDIPKWGQGLHSKTKHLPHAFIKGPILHKIAFEPMFSNTNLFLALQ